MLFISVNKRYRFAHSGCEKDTKLFPIDEERPFLCPSHIAGIQKHRCLLTAIASFA
jgi:hypothetical protein